MDLILISILEGVTEFLPISSTAHLIILSRLLEVDLSLPYIKFYLLVIQLGALLAGAFLFTKKVFSDKKILLNIVISFLPSALLGFILYKTFKHLLEGNFPLLALMLFIGGVIFIYLEKHFVKNPESFGKIDMNKTDALIVGLAQAIAIIPGVSRSGATIIAGIMRGIKKELIIEYTFLLALPTLGTAVAYDTYKSLNLFSEITSYSILYIGVAISFITAFITLYFFKHHLKRISLTYFGIYRILLSLVILFVYLF
ncbi:MAG TPA: undecaprenyl-diphosphate phosphatase [Parcubacteria group bacterium]|jgi:undecaprenyl-diphosphatase|nr:undecaprenyl-diphosphate phosphatase [Parcubacteria group bacterium]